MEAITKITLDMLHPRNRVVVHAKQLDSQTRTIQATLLCDGLVYEIPSGAVATFSARKPSDTAVWEAATINGSTVSYTLAQNDLAVAGYMEADFQIWQGNDRLSTFSFLIDVEADVVTDQEIEDNSDFTALQGLISQFTQVVAQIRDIDYTVLNPNYSLTIYYSDGTSYTTPPIGGTPTVVSTVAGMTDQSKLYVYVGSESGYTNGNWYYYNGSAWVSGGVYNSTAFETDTTLSVAGMAADAKATGDLVKTKANALEEQQTGKIVIIKDVKSGDKPTSIIYHVPITQTGSGTPTPDNVRNFIGFTGTTITNETTSEALHISFGETIFDGDVDIINGIATINNVVIELTGNESWQSNGTYERKLSLPLYLRTSLGGVLACNIYRWAGSGESQRIAFSDNLYIADDRYNSVASFKSFLQTMYANGTAVQVYLTLKTPQTISFTGGVFTFANGENRISASENTVTIAAYKDIGLYIEDVSKNDWITNDTIKKKIQASRWTKSSTINPVSLLYFSDIHGDGTELDRIMKFGNGNSDLIDDILCTGDVMSASYYSDFNFWQNQIGIEKVMVALGNHDYYVNSASDHTKVDIATVVQRLIGNYADNWGVTIPSGKSWYYKDYVDAKTRLIVLDCNLTNAEGGTEQKTWLESVLESARTSGYVVIIGTHFLYGTAYISRTFYDNPFTMWSVRGTTATPAYDWSPTTYMDTVATFINNGGLFAGWLTGHVHYDWVGSLTGYQNQLVIGIAAASPSHEHATSLVTGDLPRESGTPTADAFNIVTVDPANNLLKVVRIGADVNNRMEKRESFCYDFVNHQFI